MYWAPHHNILLFSFSSCLSSFVLSYPRAVSCWSPGCPRPLVRPPAHEELSSLSCMFSKREKKERHACMYSAANSQIILPSLPAIHPLRASLNSPQNPPKNKRKRTQKKPKMAPLLLQSTTSLCYRRILAKRHLRCTLPTSFYRRFRSIRRLKGESRQRRSPDST